MSIPILETRVAGHDTQPSSSCTRLVSIAESKLFVVFDQCLGHATESMNSHQEEISPSISDRKIILDHTILSHLCSRLLLRVFPGNIINKHSDE